MKPRTAQPRKPFDFTARPAGRSFAARGGLKDWPDEWVCQNCANVKPYDQPRKRVYCRKFQVGMHAGSDRMCFEETLDMKQRRYALQEPQKNS